MLKMETDHSPLWFNDLITHRSILSLFVIFSCYRDSRDSGHVTISLCSLVDPAFAPASHDNTNTANKNTLLVTFLKTSVLKEDNMAVALLTSCASFVIPSTPVTCMHTYTAVIMHARTHARTHAHTHTHIHTQTNKHTNKHKHKHTHKHTNTQTRKHTHARTHTQTHTPPHTHAQTRRHTHTHKHANTRTHKHKHTHKRKHTHKHTHTHARKTHSSTFMLESIYRGFFLLKPLRNKQNNVVLIDSLL